MAQSVIGVLPKAAQKVLVLIFDLNLKRKSARCLLPSCFSDGRGSKLELVSLQLVLQEEIRVS